MINWTKKMVQNELCCEYLGQCKEILVGKCLYNEPLDKKLL